MKKNNWKKKMQKWWLKKRKEIYKGICTLIATLLCISCGTTKAIVQKPAEGTYTTITITTNNPITTTTDANPNVEFLNK